MYEMGMLTRVWPDDRFEDAFTSNVEGIAAKKPIALRMGKEVMARSLETPGLDAALALERNAIQWLTSAPDMQASLTTPSRNRRHLVTEQRQRGADPAR
jgi:enoyl-CoA hydratase/carnithine racemase